MVGKSEFRFEVEFLSGPHDGDVRRLDSGEAIIGSERGVDLVVASDTVVSGKHARIQCAADGVWIEDLESDGGTLVNGDKITNKRKIGPADVVCIGHTEFVCRVSEPEPSGQSGQEKHPESKSVI
ncbi:MAG: FHA domain-containing protein [Planctomycetota bacterium]